MYHNIEIRLKIGIFADYYCGILFNTIYSRTVSCAEGTIVRKKIKNFRFFFDLFSLNRTFAKQLVLPHIKIIGGVVKELRWE